MAENLLNAGHSSIDDEGIADDKELGKIYNADTTVSSIHQARNENISSSIKEHNDPKKLLEVSKQINVILKTRRNLCKDKGSRLIKALNKAFISGECKPFYYSNLSILSTSAFHKKWILKKIFLNTDKN